MMSIAVLQMRGDIILNTMPVEAYSLSRLYAMVLQHVNGDPAAPARGIRAARKGGLVFCFFRLVDDRDWHGCVQVLGLTGARHGCVQVSRRAL